MTFLLFLLGLALLLAGGELLVRGASTLARAFRLSPLVIGLTIVGFGTSSPELIVALRAALGGQPGIAIGSALGSNISNILLILGISALIAPLVIPARKLWRDLGFMLLATAVIWAMLIGGQVGRLEGLLLLLGLAVFLATAFLTGRTKPQSVQEEPLGPAWRPWAVVGAGLALLVVGAQLMVENATTLARSFGISEAVIGLTIVAVGTSLPELATSLVAAFRRQTEIAVGNIVGSNIFNIFGILGLTALVTPVPVEPRFASIDMWWVSGSAIGLAAVAVFMGGLPRKAGLGLLAAYGVYLVFMA
ncbi:MAG TPA: calcium/sodium antiporter [Tabrizicola sp.]|nr:calcium/sodium antiporter [Tabrizicola sp.]